MKSIGKKILQVVAIAAFTTGVAISTHFIVGGSAVEARAFFVLGVIVGVVCGVIEVFVGNIIIAIVIVVIFTVGFGSTFPKSSAIVLLLIWGLIGLIVSRAIRWLVNWRTS